MKQMVKTLLAGLVLAGLAGCGGGEKQAAAKYTVIFSQCNYGEPYRAAQNALLKELFDQDPEVKLEMMDGQANAAQQIEQIERAIKLKPDLLIVAPLEREPLSKVMGQAMEAGIPTICLERDIVEPNYTTWIRCDNKEIGAMAGQWIVDHLTKKYGEAKGNLVEIRGSPGVEGAIYRHEGAHSVLANYPNIKVVHDATANWFQNEAIDRMAEALSAHKEGIDVVYGHNDPMAYGAYLAAKDKGREKEMVFVGVDGLAREGVQYVNEGMLGVTFEYPLCVDKAVEIGTKIMKDPGFKPEKTYMMDSKIVLPSS